MKSGVLDWVESPVCERLLVGRHPVWVAVGAWRLASSTMGRVGIHPRCFRKSGKERTCRTL